jgi:hypothetical protein
MKMVSWRSDVCLTVTSWPKSFPQWCLARWRGELLTFRSVNICPALGHYRRLLLCAIGDCDPQVGSVTLWHVCAPKDLLQRTRKETRPRKRMAAPLRGRGEFFVVWVRPKQDEVEMEAGAWAQRGLVPAWKGEVVHPGAPESPCVYKIR